MSASGRFEVVFHDDPSAYPTGIQLDAGALLREERWDGDAYLVLKPPGADVQEGTTLDTELDRIRNNPRLRLMNSAVVRRIEDTEALWQAWRTAMLDTISTLSETELAIIYRKETNADNHNEQIVIRDVRRRVQTAIQTWREHMAFLNREREMLVANASQHQLEEQNARAKFETQVGQLETMVTAARCVATSRVLRGAANALQNTMEERRKLRTDRCDIDRIEYLQVLQSMRSALIMFIEKFRVELRQLCVDYTKATETMEQSMQQKKESWKKICQGLSKQYQIKIHLPLRNILKHFSGGYLETLEFASGVLDDNNDPYCIKRCEVAISELDRIKEHLEKIIQQDRKSNTHTIHNTRVWDDEVTQAMREQRQQQARDAVQATESSTAQLQEERKVLMEAFHRAKTHLQKLQHHANLIETKVIPQIFQEGADNQQIAGLARVITQRQENLREEIIQTQARIETLHQEILESSKRIPTSTRYAETIQLRAIAQAVHGVCMRMQTHFLTLIQSEEGARQVVQDQLNESARTIFQQSRQVIQKAVMLAQSRCALVDVKVGQIDDNIKDATRRIDVLNRCRIEQESGMNGFEIAVFTALEQWVAANTDANRVYDTLAKVDGLIETCNHVLQLLQETHSRIPNTQ